MTRMSSRVVETFLRQYGWTFYGDQNGCWVTGWRGEERSFPLIVKLTETWLSFEVAPLMRLGIEWNHWPEVMRLLLEINQDSKLIKLGIDESGAITMSLYLFTQNLDYNEFSDALGVIGYYAEQIFKEIHSHLMAIGFHMHEAAEQTLLS